MAIAIEKKLINAGYRMLGDDAGIEKLIQDILKSKNIRYLKAIPFLIYKYNLDILTIRKNIEEIELFNTILDITARIFSELNIKRKISRHIRGDSKLEGKYAHKFSPHYNEFKNEFELQLRNDNKPDLLIDTQKIDEERNLQYGLSQLFTKKEKQIIKRLQEDKPISRSDYEYYSRKTKKKLRSIINLQDFARNIYSKTPKCDEELFELKKFFEKESTKKELEKWLSDKWKIDDSIEEYHISGNSIAFILKDKFGGGSTTLCPLRYIKDKRILELLKKYPEHDFR